jgi:hypothetical protein
LEGFDGEEEFEDGLAVELSEHEFVHEEENAGLDLVLHLLPIGLLDQHLVVPEHHW